MIVSITQHNGADPIFVTPHNTRSLIVKRRYKHERHTWGGWHSRFLCDIFPEGFELRLDMLRAGTWSALQPRTVGIPFECYVYLNNADGTEFKVDGGGVLLGALLRGTHPKGGRFLEHVYLMLQGGCVAKPLVPWIGGKRKLADHILPLFPAHSCYVEPFCGAAALFFIKPASEVEVLNDVNGDIVNLYRVVKHHLEELYKQFKWALTSRQNWEWLQATPAESLTDVQRAARFLYLQKLAFGGRVEGQSFGTATTSRPRFNLFTLEQDLAEAHWRLAQTTIERLDWQDVIKRYDRPHTLFYCDPPYWQTEGYGVDFGWDQYEALAKLATSIAGNMIISINDHPDIRALFGSLPVKEVDYEYTVGDASKCVELIYGNWRDGLPQPKGVQQGLFQ